MRQDICLAIDFRHEVVVSIPQRWSDLYLELEHYLDSAIGEMDEQWTSYLSHHTNINDEWCSGIAVGFRNEAQRRQFILWCDFSDKSYIIRTCPEWPG